MAKTLDIYPPATFSIKEQQRKMKKKKSKVNYKIS